MDAPRGLALWRTAAVVTTCLLSFSGGGLQAQQAFSVQGFFTFELEGSDGDELGPWTFDQHQVNLISIFELDDSWRVLSEME